MRIFDSNPWGARAQTIICAVENRAYLNSERNRDDAGDSPRTTDKTAYHKRKPPICAVANRAYQTPDAKAQGIIRSTGTNG